MARLRVLTSQGDSSFVWDPARAEAGDLEALAAVREAERIFREHRVAGATAFRVVAGSAERMETFDRLAEEIVVVPRLTGG